MTIDEQVIDFIRANPLSSAADTAQAMGISAGLMRGILSGLYQKELIDRVKVTSGHQYLIAPDAAQEKNAQYRRLRRLAEQLEDKCLWRRAARQWLAVMDATEDERLRGKAAERSTYCIQRSHCYRPELNDGGMAEVTLADHPALASLRF
ncbi:PerC family transcriptional regulator [Erwinia sp. V71]|uniref:PerC family transcriptional regulator n=1 Tax=Erwinia sp. V71 TaxID=3369424 RepID=UPI003F63FD27